MSFELFVALRYLFSRRKQTFISFISIISIMGVALGVASLIVVLGVMNGFSTDLRDKILGVNAHVIVMNYEGAFEDYREKEAQVEELPGVVAAAPFVYSEIMLSTRLGVKGVVLRGIDPARAGEVINLRQDMVQGSLEALDPGPDHDGPPRILVGRELASRLGLSPGSRVNLLSPSGRSSSAGFTPKVQVFEVAGVFATGMFEYDSSLTYVSLGAAADLLGFPRKAATGLELTVQDVYAADQVGTRVENALGYPFYARNWMEMNANLFAALKLEKTAMFIILILIVLVGSFSIITTLIMLVMEKTKDIAILMSMGARQANVRRIFMLQGTIIGGIGTALGFCIGIPASLLLKKYQFIKLPEDVYSLDHLPVRLEWLDLTVIGVAALALCFLATIYPARQAAKLEPAEALRYE
jgi:lipoprotein-releasing system permease protein